MKAKTNLNSINFFDQDQLKRYPVAMKTFNEWLGEYSMAISWSHTVGSTMFLCLPIEMQIGVILRFIDEHQFERYQPYCSGYYEYSIVDLTVTESIINWFTGFIQQYDKHHNPDHLVTNPIDDTDDLPF